MGAARDRGRPPTYPFGGESRNSQTGLRETRLSSKRPRDSTTERGAATNRGASTDSARGAVLTQVASGNLFLRLEPIQRYLVLTSHLLRYTLLEIQSGATRRVVRSHEIPRGRAAGFSVTELSAIALLKSSAA